MSKSDHRYAECGLTAHMGHIEVKAGLMYGYPAMSADECQNVTALRRGSPRVPGELIRKNLLAERIERQMRGLLQRGERHEANLVALVYSLLPHAYRGANPRPPSGDRSKAMMVIVTA